METEPRDTNQINRHTTKLDSRYEGQPSPPQQQPDSTANVPNTISLELNDSRRKKLLVDFAKSDAVVGRGTEEGVIDMTPHGAFEHGVSRRHAVLSRRDGGIFIEDKDSTNGTRINGFTLRPNRAYLLRQGDEIEFGRLRTTVRFNK
ncbi:MAG: FHA domain-containing protein [Chloroflexota bacterium]